MESSENTITLAKRVVDTFAKDHGITDFTVSDDGEAVLELGGVEVFLYADPDAPALHLTAPLRTLEEEDKEFEPLLEAALELNLFPDKFDDARFAYVRDMATFVLCKRIDLYALPDGKLDAPLGLYLEALQAGVTVFAPKESHAAGASTSKA